MLCDEYDYDYRNREVPPAATAIRRLVVHSLPCAVRSVGTRQLEPNPLATSTSEFAAMMASRAPFMILLFAALFLTAVAAWTGNRHARTAFILVLLAVVAVNLMELFSSLALVDQESEQWWSSFRRVAAIGAALLIWLALVCWYLLGRRTRPFFATKSMEGTGPSSM